MVTTFNLGKVSLTPKGKYRDDVLYVKLDVVNYKGSSYVVLNDNTIGITPADGANYMLIAERGASGCFPVENIVAGELSVQVPPNTLYNISELSMDAVIMPKLTNLDYTYANEWSFVVKQGNTAYDVMLPNINWVCGIAPTFAANTTTEVRLWVKDGSAPSYDMNHTNLEGMWL